MTAKCGMPRCLNARRPGLRVGDLSETGPRHAHSRGFGGFFGLAGSVAVQGVGLRAFRV